ncbi:precorrin-4 C(11)-methyltransferase [Metallumcola ferriviriculae]|uniref:Precorrin-4 C(11)-methyltransferase n=1 Tax=Metallumcola ferriviriculae TaxID=3039180 RepID=A0AAU0UKC1_9FIRM|nr:precorrin-4 C(11)-methyltransferase [Desulfitibacteraceae bacterium MK1]
MKVIFIGAGPGDPDLITVKGAKALNEADVIIYAGSLVNKEVLAHGRKDAEVYDSAGMTLEEVLAVMKKAVSLGRTVARVHTGDPCLYGAIQEQMDALAQEGIAFDIIPGVSSFLAAAASIKREYTLPDISQTVILTRLEGRTPVPEQENLAGLAKHGATMCLFLSVQMIDKVVAELRQGYPEQTPVAVVQKASWPEEKIVHGTLSNIAEKVKAAAISRTALILVGDFLGNDYQRSLLYHPEFSHGYREAKQDESK